MAGLYSPLFFFVSGNWQITTHRYAASLQLILLNKIELEESLCHYKI